MAISLENNALTYRDLEKSIHHLGAQVYQELLEQIDQWLFENRDKNVFKYLTSKTNVLRTVFGNVSITKRYYRISLPFSEPRCVYLLDEILKSEKVGTFMVTVAEQIQAMRDEAQLSYKQIAEELKETFNLDVTRQGTMKVYLTYQKYLEELQKNGKSETTG